MKSKGLLELESCYYNRFVDNGKGLDEFYDVLTKLCQTVPNKLYHYVRKDSAFHTLAKNDIFCGHTSRMNDPCEVCLGCTEFIKYCRRKAVLDEMHLQALENILRADLAFARLQNQYPAFMPYIFCMMPEEEAVYQWRNYTSKENGGYCFCFDVAKLNEAIRMVRRKMDGASTLLLLKCFYVGQDDGAIEQLFDALVGYLNKPLQIFAKDAAPLNNISNLICIKGVIFTIASLIKDKKWANEQEWRLMLIPGCTSCDKQYKGIGLTDCKKAPVQLMSMIIISPHGDQTSLKENLKRLNPDAAKIAIDSCIDKSVVDNYIAIQDKYLDRQYEEYVLEVLGKNRQVKIIPQEEYVVKHPKGAFHV